MICSGKSEGTILVEVKSADQFKKESFPKAISLPEVELYTS